MESLEEKNGIVKTELQPLLLPEGITEDELSKVIINILLRRALCEKNPLSKWVLLGALEVIQGRNPKMTATMLSQLVNISQKSEECSFASKSSVKNQECRQNKVNSITYKSVGSQVEQSDFKQFVDKSSQVNIVATTKDIDVQCRPVTHSKEVQYEPSTRDNWAQTLIRPKLASKSSQTPLKNPKGDVDYYVKLKYKPISLDAKNSPKQVKNKSDEAETSNYKKSNGEVDTKSIIDVEEIFKQKKTNGGNEKSINLENMGVLEHSLKNKRSKGGVESSSNHRNTKESAEGGDLEEIDKEWKLIKVDGIPEQKKKANRLAISTVELEIPLYAMAVVQDPRFQY